MDIYKGHCHCGAVTFTVEADLEKSITCNCSRCEALGLILTFVPAAQFTLLSGEENLTKYHFNKKTIDHLFCATCGVESFARATNKAGVATVAINIRCLDNVDLSALKPTAVDGKNW